MAETPSEKRMKLRYAGICRACGTAVDAGVEAVYERSTKTVQCINCSTVDPAQASASSDTVGNTIDIGTPGASARREFERRRTGREARTRAKHPKLGGLILAFRKDPQSTMAWDGGARGEERLGERLNEFSTESVRVLHDRLIPGTRGNIDHIAVTPSGVYVIDAKRYKGKRPTLKIEGGIFRPRTEKLLVGGRDQTKLVDGVIKQTDVVRAIVADDVPVTGVLCFVDADWPLIGGAFTTRGVEVLWPKKFYPRLVAGGSHAAAVARLHHALAVALPRA